MASTAGNPERVAVKPVEQALTHAQLRDHAVAAHGRVASSGPTSGMRTEHSALLSAGLGGLRGSLSVLASRNANGAAAATDFGGVEDVNRQSVESLGPEIPRLA